MMGWPWFEKIFNHGIFIKLRSNKRALNIFLIGFWSLFIALILWGGWQNRQVVIPYLEQANYSYLILVLMSYMASLASVLVGWSLIMNALKVPINFWKNSQIYCLTLAARRLPGTIWYIGGRLLVYQRLNVSKAIVALASGIEFVIVLISGSIIGLISVFYTRSSLPVVVIAGSISVVMIGILLFHPAIRKILSKASGKEATQFVSSIEIIGWVLAYCAMWLFSGLMVVQLVEIFQPIEGKEQIFVIGSWALSGIAGMLTFFFPSSFGIAEISLTALLSQIMPLPLAGVIAILSRLFTILLEVILSLLMIPFSKSLTKNERPDSQTFSS